MVALDVDPPLAVCAHCKAIFRSGFSRCPSDGTELGPLVQDPFEGQVFAGRYAIETFVGQGAMGRVYRARHTRMSKRFAVKIMFGDLASDAIMRARFQSEAEAASRLDHPNVVSVVDFGDTVGGLVYMVMDFVEGQSLARMLELAGGPIPEVRVRNLMRQIAAGLQHAHDRGLVHRDLKTDNVVVVESEGEEVARIIDFGIAMFADAAPGPAKLTAVGVVIGTPAYMSPEQACGEKIDHRSDLFSLGIMAYELLAGRKPFDGHPFEMARQNIASTPPPIRDRAPLAIVDPGLEAIVFRLLAKSRDERFPTAQALIEALDAVESGDTEATLKLAAPPAAAIARARAEAASLDLSMERPVAAPPRSRGGLWAAAAVVVVAAGGAVAYQRWGAPVAAPIDDPPPVARATLAPAPDPSPLAGTASQAAVMPVAEVAPTEAAPEELTEDDPDEPAPAAKARAARRATSPRARPVAEAEEPISASTLTQRFRQVSVQVDLLSKQRGPRFAEVYQEKLKRVGALYAVALRDRSKQRQAAEEVERLRQELSRL